MTLTLIAEVLAGETLVTPGGPVDTATACGLEAFTWDSWLEEQISQAHQEHLAAVEVRGTALTPAEALAD